MNDQDRELLLLKNPDRLWVQLSKVLERVVQQKLNGGEFSFQVASEKSDFDLSKSVSVEVDYFIDGRIKVEIHGNKFCNPKLGSVEQDNLERLGWHRWPAKDDNPSPNYWCRFEADASAFEIAQHIVVGLVRAYELSRRDHFIFDLSPAEVRLADSREFVLPVEPAKFYEGKQAFTYVVGYLGCDEHPDFDIIGYSWCEDFEDWLKGDD